MLNNINCLSNEMFTLYFLKSPKLFNCCSNDDFKRLCCRYTLVKL